MKGWEAEANNLQIVFIPRLSQLPITRIHMTYLAKILLVVHIVVGSFAVFIGLLALVVRKPSGATNIGRLHRRSGNLFVVCMTFIIGTAVGLTLISLDPYFAGLTASAAIAVFSGNRVLKRKRPDLNSAQRARLLDWLVTLLVAAVGLMLVILAAAGSFTKNVPVVYAMGVGSLLYAGYDVYRFVRPSGFPFSPNLWLYEHLVKMIGGYFGAVAAFSGSVLVLLPPPWRQLWATMFGQMLVIVLIVYYRRKLNARKSSAENKPNAQEYEFNESKYKTKRLDH